jgi:hypothetical protein
VEKERELNMYKFLSGITLENRDVLISKNTDSHHGILSEFKISDREIPPNFCAWEFTPPIEDEKYNYAADLNKWSFNVDEQFPKPEWWNAGIEKLTVDECKKRVEEFLIRTDTERIESGRWIILGGTVESILGGTVESIRGGTVKYILGGTVTVFINNDFKPNGSAIIIDKSGKNTVFITAKNKFEDK